MLNADWLVQVYALNKEGNLCIGTGYSIGNGLVLTARHVVRFDARADNPQLKLVWPEQSKHEMPFVDADIVFDGGKDLDLAVIRCPQDTSFKPPKIEWFPNDPMLNAVWASRGFPRAGKEAMTRNDLGVPGKVAGLKKHVMELTTEVDATEAKGWGGFSGAPVFIGRQLVAVITHDYLTVERYFRAVSIPWLLRERPDFCQQVGYTAHERLAKDDGKFKTHISHQISRELSRPDARPLREYLMEQFTIGEDSLNAATKVKVEEKLLGLGTDDAIRYLTLAMMNCLHEDGFRYAESLGSVTNIKKIAEELLGWLVLSSVNESEIAKLFPIGLESDSLYFVMGHVSTLGGVEIILSHRFQRKSEWLGSKERTDQRSPYHVPVKPEFFSHDDAEVVRKLLLEIWNKVFDSPLEQKRENATLTQKEIADLNAALRARRKKLKNSEHYHLAFSVEMLEPERVRNVYRQLLAHDKLSQLTVVEFGNQHGSKMLLIDERAILAEINEFYREIDKQEKRQEPATA